MAQGGAFFGDLVTATGAPAAEVAATLWLLVWAGEVTNDAYAPVRAPRALRTSVRQAPAGGRRLRRRASATSPAIAGRWLPAAPLFSERDARPTGHGRGPRSCSSGTAS